MYTCFHPELGLSLPVLDMGTTLHPSVHAAVEEQQAACSCAFYNYKDINGLMARPLSG